MKREFVNDNFPIYPTTWGSSATNQCGRGQDSYNFMVFILLFTLRPAQLEELLSGRRDACRTDEFYEESCTFGRWFNLQSHSCRITDIDQKVPTLYRHNDDNCPSGRFMSAPHSLASNPR